MQGHTTAGILDPSVGMLPALRPQQPLLPTQGDRGPRTTSLATAPASKYSHPLDPVRQQHQQKEPGPRLSFQLSHKCTEETVMHLETSLWESLRSGLALVGFQSGGWVEGQEHQAQYFISPVTIPPVLKQGTLRQRKHHQNPFLSKLKFQTVLRELKYCSPNGETKILTHFVMEEYFIFTFSGSQPQPQPNKILRSLHLITEPTTILL